MSERKPDSRKFLNTLVVISLIMVFISLVTVFLIIERAYNKQIDQFNHDRISRLSVEYESVIQNVSRQADLIFQEIIDQPEYTGIMARAIHADGEEDRYRKQLYKALLDRYNRLINTGLKQLHFHEADNISFLRMHRPDVYGDDLSDIRTTIAEANRSLQPVVGFEEGRIFNGFRNVYPLFYGGEHIGSVEISYSANQILKDINELFPSTFDFIIQASVVGDKVFLNEQSNYLLSGVSDDFLVEKNRYSELVDRENKLNNLQIDIINLGFRSNYGAGMLGYLPAVYPVRVDRVLYTVTTLPVINIKGIPVGYILMYDDGIDLDHILQNRGRDIFLLFLFAGVLAATLISLLTSSRKLTRQKRQLELVLETRNRFLRSMSHELRTPLNGIIGFAEILRDDATLSEQKKFLTHIIRGGRHLLQLINDILDFAKFEALGVKIFNSAFAVQPFFESIQDFFSAQAAQKGLSIKLNIASEVPPAIFSDELRIRQIIVNLVGNALKFTDAGFVQIDVDAAGQSTVPLRLRISVADSGIGMSAEEQARVFEEFHQVDNQGEKFNRGTGLGLTIVSRISKAMSGTISLESTPGKGSRFTVELPVKIADPSSLRLRDESGLKPAVRGTMHGTILIVEDNQINSLYLSELLMGQGLDTRIAVNGREALKILEQEDFDIILMDVQMPIMDGYEATREIRRIETLEKRKRRIILGVTAGVLDEDIDRCYEAGMNSVIRKPVERDRLFNLLYEVIAELPPGPVQEQTSSLPDILRELEPRLTMVSLEHYLNYIPDSKLIPSLKETLPLYFDDTIPQLRRLRRILLNQGIEEANKEAHALKSTVQYLKCSELADRLIALELTSSSADAIRIIDQIEKLIPGFEADCLMIERSLEDKT